MNIHTYIHTYIHTVPYTSGPVGLVLCPPPRSKKKKKNKSIFSSATEELQGVSRIESRGERSAWGWGWDGAQLVE